MSEFKERVIYIINSIPYGQVMSYGQISAYAGVARGARHVGALMQKIDPDISFPWWRVVNNAGYISIRGNLHSDKHLQKKLLEAEGVEISNDFTLDINKYRFIAPEALFKKFQLKDEYIQMLHARFFSQKNN